MNIYQKAIEVFGEDSQLEKLLEELGELTQAVQKYKQTKNEETLEHLREEIADAYNMIVQVTLMFDENEIQRIRQAKLKRLKKIIDQMEERKIDDKY